MASGRSVIRRRVSRSGPPTTPPQESQRDALCPKGRSSYTSQKGQVRAWNPVEEVPFMSSSLLISRALLPPDAEVDGVHGDPLEALVLAGVGSDADLPELLVEDVAPVPVAPHPGAHPALGLAV